MGGVEAKKIFGRLFCWMGNRYVSCGRQGVIF
jgi:hypothetical protein